MVYIIVRNFKTVAIRAHTVYNQHKAAMTQLHEENNPAEPIGINRPTESPAKSIKGGFPEVWKLAYPVVITMASTSLMGVTDTLFMGYVGTSEQGAVGLGAVLSWTCMSFFNGTITTTNTFVAQFFGSKQYKEIGRVLWQAIYFALFAGLIIWVLAIPNTDQAVQAIGASSKVTGFAVQYVDIRLYGSVFMFLNFCVVGFLRGIGDTRTPMKVALFANAINIGLTYLLVFGKLGFSPLGVRGAALGTIVSQAVACGIYFILIVRRKHQRFDARGPHRLDLYLLRRWLKIGVPTGVWWILQMGGFTVFTMFVSTLGDDILAGHQIVRQVMHLSFLPGTALAITATVLVGQYIGAKDVSSATRSAHTAIKIGVIIMGSMGGLFMLSRHLIVAAFSQDPAVQEVASNLFIFVAVYQTVDAFGTVSSGAIRGAGDTRWPMVVSLIMSWFFFVPSVLILGGVLNLGIYGAWTGATLHSCILGVVMFGRFRRGRWKSMKI